VGQESLNGSSVQHIRVSKLAPGVSGQPDSLILQLSEMDVYLDPQSLLPQAIRFNIHPDTSSVNIPVEIDYSNYQVVDGIRVPFHIQKYIQNGLSNDLVITAVTFNSGLTSNDFQAK
jgi:hypothetical protein